MQDTSHNPSKDNAGRNGKSKYDILLKDDAVKRWYDNVARGSMITAQKYLRRLGSFCLAYQTTPKDLVELSEKKIYDLFLDVVTQMEKNNSSGGYIKDVLKSIKSWLSFNDIEIKKKIRIKAASETPTLQNERTPTKDELRKIFLSGDEKTRAISILIAHSGLRLEVLGNFDGADGLRIADLPELEIKDGKAGFKEIPTLVRVRSSLSKKRHEYFTFLSKEGCEYLKSYLEMRMTKGEKLKGDSAVITPKTADKPFIRTTNIGDAVRKSMRKAGFGWRPYVLRRYFATQLMVAESKGALIRDYRVFWMGHKGDEEHTYTVNKGLPQEVIEDMREAYKKAQKHLQTVETEKDEEDIKAMFKKQLLLVAGFKAEDIKDGYLEMEDEEFQKVVRDKLVKGMENNGNKQKVVESNEVENYVMKGWEFVSVLPNNKAVLKLPELS